MILFNYLGHSLSSALKPQKLFLLRLARITKVKKTRNLHNNFLM